MTSVLLSQIQAKFAERFPRLSESGAIIFPAAHAEVGDLEVHDDGDEITIYIGKFTHVHINCYENGLSQVERERKIIADALSFLEDLFSDQIEFYGTHRGGGGCRPRSDLPRGAVSRLVFGSDSYVWSGPLRK